MSAPIFAAGRRVGEVRRGVFVKHVRGSLHFLRQPAAIALDRQSLADAERAGAQSVRVVDSETGREYCARVAFIRARGFKVSRGFGEQIGLALSEWRGPGEALPDTPTQARQLELVL